MFVTHFWRHKVANAAQNRRNTAGMHFWRECLSFRK